MKKRFLFLLMISWWLCVSPAAWCVDYNYVQSLHSYEDLHESPSWILTQWTGFVPGLQAAVTGAPDYVPEPQAGDALGWQQGFGNYVLDFGYEFTQPMTLWHFGGINWDGEPNNLVYMRVSTDASNWSDRVQLRDVAAGGNEVFEDTYALNTFGVSSARYLKIEKTAGGAKTGKFVDAVGVAAEPQSQPAQYWGGVGVPNWSGDDGYTRQSWGFDTEPAWQEEDTDNDGDSDAFVLSGNGYAADHAKDNSYGDAVFIRTDFGDSFAWDWVDEGPMGQNWIGIQGMMGGMGTGTLDFKVDAMAAPGMTKEVWLQYVIFIPTGSDGSAVSARLASDSGFANPVGTRTDKQAAQIHELDDQGGTGDWWRVSETWQIDSPGNTDYIQIVTADHGTANMLDSMDILTRTVDGTPPAVTATVPDDQATDVPTDTAVRITFSEMMDIASPQMAFGIDPAVAGDFSWSNGDTQLIFVPEAELGEETTYAVTMGTGAEDHAGNRMAQAHTFSFTTAAPQENRPPEIGTLTDRTVAAETEFTFIVEATDPDQDSLTYTFSSNPGITGADLDATTGRFTWTPDAGKEGVYAVTFTVTDSGTPKKTVDKGITITVEKGNQPPVMDALQDRSVEETEAVTFTVKAVDPDDGNTVTYSYTAVPALTGATLNSITGEFSWTPAEGSQGSYELTFTATDNGTPEKSATAKMTLTVGLANQPPELASIANQQVNEGEALGFTVQATDPEGDTVTYTYTASPAMAGASLNDTTGAFTWTPAMGNHGEYSVTFTATDNGDPQASATVTLTVTVNRVNQAPALNPIPNRQVNEGETLSFTVQATDPDGDTVFYTYTANPALVGATLDPNTGNFSWTPGSGTTGSYAVTVTAMDNGTPPQSATQSLTISVGRVNQPPELAGILNQQVNEGETLSFTVQATDPDGDTVNYAYTATPALAGAILDDTTGVFSWTPGNGTAGDYSVTVSATDNGTPPRSATRTLTISVGRVNQPPELAAIGDQRINEGGTLSFTVQATDPDGDTVSHSYTATPDLAGATLDPDSGVFNWTPGAGTAGDYSVTFTATDSGSPALSDEETVTLTVTTVVDPAGPDQTVTEQTTVVLGISGGNTGSPSDTYVWEQQSGPTVTLGSPRSPTPSFVAPAVAGEEAVLVFHVTVNAVKTDEARITVTDNGIELSEAQKQHFATADVFFHNPVGAEMSGEDNCYMGIGCAAGDVTFYEVRDPGDMTDQQDIPEDMIYGVFDFNVAVTAGGQAASVVIYLPEPAPEDSRWFKYSDSQGGWVDFSREKISDGTGDGAVFNAERTRVTLYITDGGPYDDDGKADGQVRDPSGLGTPRSGNSGSACFISTVMSD